MKKFKNIWSQTLTFSVKTGKKMSEYIIPTNEEAELPADNSYVRRLVAQGYLQEVSAPAPANSNDKSSKPQ